MAAQAVPDLGYFDLEGLVRRLNSNLAPFEEPLKIEGFVSQRPSVSLARYVFHGITENSGYFSLIQSHDMKFMHWKNEEEIGRIKVETGRYEEYSSESYKRVELHIHRPLRLMAGTVSKGIIRISSEEDEGWPAIRRDDKIIKFGFLKTSADLNTVIPVNWFFREDFDMSQCFYH